MSSSVPVVSLEKKSNDNSSSTNVTTTASATAPGTSSSSGFSPGKLIVAPAVKNTDFLMSSAGRTMRMIAEFEEYPKRMERLGIRGSFLFFGSARSKYKHQYESQMATLLQAQQNAAANSDNDEKAAASMQEKIDALKALEWTAEYMVKTEELAKKLTEWAMSSEGREAGMWCKSRLHPNTAQITDQSHILYGPRGPAVGTVSSCKVSSSSTTHNEYTFEQPLVVCTGGGPGFMEAGNKGAYDAGGTSMGVAITLPFETEINSFVTPGLHFQMDYFFTRKFWEVFSAKAMICCPGGMGTCDEMFEVLTLQQCQHCQPMPIVLLGKQFWQDVINWDKFAKYGVISKKEVDALLFTDSVDEAFEFIIAAISREAKAEKERSSKN